MLGKADKHTGLEPTKTFPHTLNRVRRKPRCILGSVQKPSCTSLQQCKADRQISIQLQTPGVTQLSVQRLRSHEVWSPCLTFLISLTQWLRGGYLLKIVLLLAEEVHLCSSEGWDVSLQGWVKLHPLQGTPFIFQVILLNCM